MKEPERMNATENRFYGLICLSWPQFLASSQGGRTVFDVVEFKSNGPSLAAPLSRLNFFPFDPPIAALPGQRLLSSERD